MSDRDLVDLILEFTQQMNELELKYYPLIQKDRDNISAVFANFKVKTEHIYRKYLTSKERNYYTGISSPPRFAAVNDMSFSEVEYIKNRAVVTIYTRKGLVDFQFILMNKNNQWLINSFKQRYHSEDRTSAYKWQYGTF